MHDQRSMIRDLRSEVKSQRTKNDQRLKIDQRSEKLKIRDQRSEVNGKRSKKDQRFKFTKNKHQNSQ